MVSSREEARGPAAPSGLVSLVRLPHSWFILCASRELGRKPLARMLQGTPLVLFRDAQGKAAALVDRCPHRNVPLSLGRVVGGQLQCGYHGWRFDAAGQCRAIPGLVGEPEARSRCALAHATREQQGFVWVYSTPGVEPTHEPYLFPLLESPGYSTVRRVLRVKCAMHAFLENTLDVPHTAFLHGGLFRTEKKPEDLQELEVVVRRSATSVEAEYVGESRPEGLVGRMLAPRGGVLKHFDRFLLPSIAQVEYQLGEDSHFLISSALTPADDWDTWVYAVVTFRLPLPHWLIKPFITPVSLHIFQQDARMLERQTETIRRFGSESFVSSEVDVLGPAILRLMRQVERGKEAAPQEVHETRLKMQV